MVKRKYGLRRADCCLVSVHRAGHRVDTNERETDMTKPKGTGRVKKLKLRKETLTDLDPKRKSGAVKGGDVIPLEDLIPRNDPKGGQGRPGKTVFGGGLGTPDRDAADQQTKKGRNER